MKSLFSTEAFEEIMGRLDKLRPDSPAQWGQMNAAQMLAHCSQPLKVSMGLLKVKEPFYKRWVLVFFKKKLYDDSEWDKGLPTARQFKMTGKKDFQTELKTLKLLVRKFYQQKEIDNWPKHPVFGKLTRQQWGQAQYKHLNHHLKQFGV